MGEEIIRARRYRFGPLAQRGLLGEIRGGQAAILGVVVLSALGAVRNLSGSAGALVAVLLLAGSAAAAFGRIRSRGADEWVPVLARFGARRVRGRTAWRSPIPTAGEPSAEQLILPPELADIELLAAPFRGGTVGVCKGVLDGTYTAVLAVQAHGFGLAESREQERAGDQWGTALASLSAEQSPISRISWVERSLPSDGDELGRYLASERDQTVALEAPAMQSYLELIEEPGTAGKEHELFLAMQITSSRARARIREEGGGDDGACTVLLRELAAWALTLGAGQMTIRGVLTPRMLARVLRTHYDPFARQGLARNEALHGENDGGIRVSQAAPSATEEAWGTYRADGAVHTTYWISAWPRFDVGIQFLAPLLLSGDVVRTTAVVMDVLAPGHAETKVEHERTSDIARTTKRRRDGYMTSARDRRRSEATAAREEELSRGHALVRHAGFVTVSSPSLNEHRRTCLQIETLARRARLELRPMYGEQPAGLTYTAPLCRGLK